MIPGQLVPTTITSLSAGGRVVQLTVDPQAYTRGQLSEVSTVGSLLPGHQLYVLITAVLPSGLNVRLAGFFDGTIDQTHLGLEGEDIDDKYKIGKKIRARVIYDNLAITPRRFGLSVLPHILELRSPVKPGSDIPLEQEVAIGKVLSSVKVTRVVPEWGLQCRTEDGLEGFVHVSYSVRNSDRQLTIRRSVIFRMREYPLFLERQVHIEWTPSIEREFSAIRRWMGHCCSVSSRKCWIRCSCRSTS